MIPASILDPLQKVLAQFQDCAAIRPADPSKVVAAKAFIDDTGRLRGRPFIYPMVPSGRASGPFVEMTDGSVKMDLIAGIGVHLFGHGHPELLLAGAKAALKGTTMQGTLMPGEEYGKLLKLLVGIASGETLPHLPPEAKTQIAGGWLTTCGTMSNELALKILRQKKAPAYKLITFKGAFAGRSTAMQELTDEPKYREGQPTFDQFAHIPFYDAGRGVQENIDATRKQLSDIVGKEPGKYCGFGFEIIQGEGGAFRGAPREWWTAILTHARSLGLGIWFDEVQTFGRTGEVFAFQRLGLGEFADVVSLAKPLQAAAVLWTKEYEPKPGLIAGTFAGGTVSLALGLRIVEMLVQGGYLGPQGRIQKLERFIREDWETRKRRVGEKFAFGDAHITGGMVAFKVLDGKAETIKKFLDKLFENGVVGFSAGKDPVFVRFLPPVGVMTEEQWTTAMNVFERTLEEFSDVRPS
jgi:acetylornithine/N-succinyldiaminopimelate aminotransferase